MIMQFSKGQPYKGKKPFIKHEFCGRSSHVKDDCYWLKNRLAEDQIKINDKEHKKKNYIANSERKPYISYNAHYDKNPYDSHFERRKNFIVNIIVNEEKKAYVNIDASSNFD